MRGQNKVFTIEKNYSNGKDFNYNKVLKENSSRHLVLFRKPSNVNLLTSSQDAEARGEGEWYG